MKNKINAEINKIKKDLYLKAASTYFDRKGYQNFKISQLARELEISVGTIYNLFNSKDDLYLEYLILKLENFLFKLKFLPTADMVIKNQFLGIEKKPHPNFKFFFIIIN